MNKTVKFITILPTLMYGVVALVVLWIVYRLFIQSDDPYTKDIKKNNLSYDESQYVIWADMLQAALTAADDEETVYTVFRNMKTNDDVKQLIKAFGRRTWLSIPVFFYSASLNEVITVKLNELEIQTINGILADNGITIKF